MYKVLASPFMLQEENYHVFLKEFKYPQMNDNCLSTLETHAQTPRNVHNSKEQVTVCRVQEATKG